MAKKSELVVLNNGDIVNNKYEILDEAGRGGKGIVYKALDIETNNERALKFPSQGNEKVLRKDGYDQVRLVHPNIIKTYSVEYFNEIPFIVMDFVKGPNAAEWVREKGVPETKTLLDWIKKITLAIDYAHSSGFVHGDFKPSNIILPKTGPIIIDFGHHPDLEERLAQSHTQSTTNVSAITRDYAAPELVLQALERGITDPNIKSDMFSMGLVIYELSTGESPFQHMPYPPYPTELNSKLPKKFDEIWRKTADRNPEKRITAAELVGILKEIDDEMSAPKPKPEPVPAAEEPVPEYKPLVDPSKSRTLTPTEKRALIKPKPRPAPKEKVIISEEPVELRIKREKNNINLINLYGENSQVTEALNVFYRMNLKNLSDDESSELSRALVKLMRIDFLSLNNGMKVYSALIEFAEKKPESWIVDISGFKSDFASMLCKGAYNGLYKNPKKVYEIAEKLCNEVLKDSLLGGRESPLNTIGVISMARGKHEEAKSYFMQAIQEKDRICEPYLFNNLGIAEALSRQYSNAHTNFKKAVDNSGYGVDNENNLPRRKFHLALAKFYLNNYDSAIVLAKESNVPGYGGIPFAVSEKNSSNEKARKFKEEHQNPDEMLSYDSMASRILAEKSILFAPEFYTNCWYE